MGRRIAVGAVCSRKTAENGCGASADRAAGRSLGGCDPFAVDHIAPERMAFDIDGDEGALRDDLDSPPAQIGQHGGHQLRADAPSFVIAGYERVRQHDRVALLFVIDASGLTVEVERIAAAGFVVPERVFFHGFVRNFSLRRMQIRFRTEPDRSRKEREFEEKMYI